MFDVGVSEFQRYRIAVLRFETIDAPGVDGTQQVFVHLAVIQFGFVFAENKKKISFKQLDAITNYRIKITTTTHYVYVLFSHVGIIYIEVVLLKYYVILTEFKQVFHYINEKTGKIYR